MDVGNSMDSLGGMIYTQYMCPLQAIAHRLAVKEPCVLFPISVLSIPLPVQQPREVHPGNMTICGWPAGIEGLGLGSGMSHIPNHLSRFPNDGDIVLICLVHT